MIEKHKKAYKADHENDQSKKETSNPDKHEAAHSQELNKAMCAFSLSNFLTLLFSACLVIAAFLTFLAICAQVWIYNCQLKEMGKATNAATDAAKAATESLEFAKATVHLDQRAWVAVVEIKGIPELGKLFKVIVTSKNTGKTFAKKLKQLVIIEVVAGDKAPNFALEEGATAQQYLATNTVALLAPNSSFETTTELSKDVPPNETAPSDLDKIAKGEIAIFVHGKLTYDDIFGRSHWSTFSFKLKPNLTYISYGEHNEADEDS